MTEQKMAPTKAMSDLHALMQELELVESSPFNKNTASRLSSWSHTWLKSHGHAVIAQFNGLQAAPAPDGEVVGHVWTDLVNDEIIGGVTLDVPLSKLEHGTKLYTTPQASVIDESMVKRACNAYDNQLDNLLYLESLAIYPAMHAALKAALEQSK